MVDLLKSVGKYIDAEEFMKTKESGFADDGATRAKRKHESFDRSSGKKRKPNQQMGDRDQAPMTFSPLSRPIQEVMVVAEAQNLLKKWGKLKSPSL